MQYFLAMRPVMGLFAVGLCLAGFRLQHRNLAELPLIYLVLVSCVVFVACSCSMLQNDLCDRKRDIRKGKTFAIRNNDSLCWIHHRMGWLLGIMLAGIWELSLVSCWMTIALIFISIYFYEKSYRHLVWPTAIVAFCSASPILYSLTWKPQNFLAGGVLFLTVFAAIFAREILKDIEDLAVDDGHKATLPLALGTVRAQWLGAGICLTTAIVVVVLASDTPLVILASLLFVCGVALWRVPQIAIGKATIDVCCVLLLVLILSGNIAP